MATKKKIVIKKKTFINHVRETFTKHKRLIIWIVAIVVLAAVLWFVFRKVKTDWSADRSAERNRLTNQIKESDAKRVADSIRHRQVEDSLYMKAMGIESRVEYIVKWRKEYVKVFVDTASFDRKRIYLDSLFGPR